MGLQQIKKLEKASARISRFYVSTFKQQPIPEPWQKHFIDIPDNYTSEETERVEHRPLKRDIISYSSTSTSRPPHTKRIRHTIGSPFDSPIAGPSTK